LSGVNYFFRLATIILAGCCQVVGGCFLAFRAWSLLCVRSPSLLVWWLDSFPVMVAARREPVGRP
jgi:hypothetical protein